MKKTLVAASIALTLGTSAVVSAQVDILQNGGAEDGVLAPWTGDGTVTDFAPNVRTGTWAFRAGDTTADSCDDAEDGACIEQEVSISGAVGDLTCLTDIDEESVPNSSVEASGYVKIRDDGDTATLSVTDGAATQSASAVYTDDSYAAIETGSLPLPDPYDTVTVNLGSTGVTDANNRVFGDDLELNLTCVTDYVKAGGRNGAKGNKGKGKGQGAPDTETFEGGFWHQATGADTTEVMGMLTVYDVRDRDPKETWTIVADLDTSLVFGGEICTNPLYSGNLAGCPEVDTVACDAYVSDAEMTRSTDEPPAVLQVDEDVNICFVERDKESWTPSDKDRGEVYINGIQDDVCDEGSSSTDDCLFNLTGGNVIVDEGVVPE